ncbi:protein kinase domain-containing protein [Brachybacterium alimentarium]|uniref:protein kinase domain-containing protein n=1 Tax=Brachybacterium alimentarium TaxID=47845 RepID=UPI003FCFA9E8
MLNVGSNYIARELLGTGATGDVWRGSDREDAPVAIKILHPEFAGRRDVVHRFIQERELLTEIDHPHVVRVHDLIYDRGTLAIVMDMVTGGDLSALLLREGPLPLERVRTLAAEVAMGLAAIHAADIVHLDLKPGNVLIQLEGGSEHALIADLGVSQLAQGPAGVAEHPRFGTPQYTAPEVVKGGAVGSAADVYALGLLIVEMLDGSPALGAIDPDDVFEILEAQVSEEIERPSAADDLTWQLVSTMLAKDPDERPTAAEAALGLGASARELDAAAFRGAASALGTGAPEDEHPQGTSEVTRPDGAVGGKGSGALTVNLGHRTSILRSAQTVRFGARGSRTIALPAALQPGALAQAGGGEPPGAGGPAADGASVRRPRRRGRFAVGLALGLAVVLGAVAVGTLLPLGEVESPPTTSTASSVPEGSVTVEDVSGMTEDAARDALGEAVEVKTIKVPGESGQEGTVLGTQPEAGSTVEQGSTVTLAIATGLETRPLASLPANTAGGRTTEESVAVGGTPSEAIVVRANRPEVQVTYMVQARYISVEARMSVPDDGTLTLVTVEVDGELVAEETIEPGGSAPLTADVTDAQRLTLTATSSDDSTNPVIALSEGILAGEEGTVPSI